METSDASNLTAIVEVAKTAVVATTTIGFTVAATTTMAVMEVDAAQAIGKIMEAMIIIIVAGTKIADIMVMEVDTTVDITTVATEVSMIGNAVDTTTGSTAADMMIGSTAANTMIGSTAADTMIGSAGAMMTGGVEAMMTVGVAGTTTDSLFMTIGNKDTTIDSVVGTMIGSAAAATRIEVSVMTATEVVGMAIEEKEGTKMTEGTAMLPARTMIGARLESEVATTGGTKAVEGKEEITTKATKAVKHLFLKMPSIMNPMVLDTKANGTHKMVVVRRTTIGVDLTTMTADTKGV